MFGYYETRASCRSPSDIANDITDEEIAYQLQLEALAESPHHYDSKFLPSSSSEPPSSSGSRMVRKFGPRNSDQASVAPLRYFDRRSSRQRNRLDASTLPLALNNALNAERDGALSSDAVSGSTKQRHWLHEVFGVVPIENTGSSGDREPILEMECGICTETRSHTSFISTPGCNHEYCSECCKSYAEVKVSSGSSQIQCPHDGCSQNFDIMQCREFLSQPSFDILTTRQTEAAIPSSQKVYCPFQDCSAFMEKPANSSRSSRFVECVKCHRGFCLKCNTPWHANKTCEEYRADVKDATKFGDEKLRDLARKEKWQVCSECGRVISLKDGCYHMTCLCGNEFCYTCGARWKNKVASCKCKLWDESNIIRPRPVRRFHGRADVNLHANPNPNPVPFPNARALANARANVFAEINPHPLCDAHPFVNPLFNAHANVNAGRLASVHPNPFATVHANPFANANPNSYPFARARPLERRHL